VKTFGIVGWKNAGKTTLVERLVAEITSRGFVVSTIKHAHHTFDLDQPHKDSFRHRAAGAQEVILASSSRWVLMHELRGKEEPDLAVLLARLLPADLVLVEGYKSGPHPKLEICTAVSEPLPNADGTIRAKASKDALASEGLPCFDLDDVESIADFILASVGLT
jgi:molybdopterin-guanine dinucleotide biosynthesis protein MobB